MPGEYVAVAILFLCLFLVLGLWQAYHSWQRRQWRRLAEALGLRAVAEGRLVGTLQGYPFDVMRARTPDRSFFGEIEAETPIQWWRIGMQVRPARPCWFTFRSGSLLPLSIEESDPGLVFALIKDPALHDAIVALEGTWSIELDGPHLTYVHHGLDLLNKDDIQGSVARFQPRIGLLLAIARQLESTFTLGQLQSRGSLNTAH